MPLQLRVQWLSDRLTMALSIGRWARGIFAGPPVPWARTLVVVELPPYASTLHFRAYTQRVRGGSLLDWVVRQFREELGREAVLSIITPPQEAGRVREALRDTPEALIQVSHLNMGLAVDLGHALARTDARRVLLVDATAALIPKEVWLPYWREHVARGHDASLLGAVPCSRPPVIMESRALAFLSVVGSPAYDIRSALLSADHSGPVWAQRNIKVETIVPDASTQEARRGWPYQVSLELPEDIDRLSAACEMAEDQPGGRMRGALAHWVAVSRKHPAQSFPDGAQQACTLRAQESLGVFLPHSASGLSGVEEVMCLLANGIPRRVPRKYHFSALITVGGVLTDRLARAGADVRIAGWDFAAPSADNFKRCRAGLAELSPDLVHAHGRMGVPMSCAVIERRVPLVQHVHVAHVPALVGLEDQLRCAAHVIAVSEFVKDRVLRLGLDPEKVSVVHNGVPSFGMSTEDRDQLRCQVLQDLELPRNARILLMPARFAPNKRHDVALAVMKALSSSFPEARLLLVGEAQPPYHPLREAIERQVEQMGLSGRVRFLGFCASMSRLYAAADVLLLPSEDEPFGLVAVEAMAADVPVVVTNSGGLPEIVEHERSGLLVPPGDVAAFATAAGRVLMDQGLRRALVVGGQRRYRSAFQLDHFVAGVSSVYERLLEVEPGLEARQVQ